MDSSLPNGWLRGPPRPSAVEARDLAADALTEAALRDATWLANLVRTIESEVVPRLLLAHRADAPAEAVALGDAHVAEFAILTMRHDHTVARAYVDALRQQGASLESIYLDLLSPTARRLGDLWCEDRCDFAMVTIGLGCLQNVLHGLGPEFCAETTGGARRGKIVLCAAQREQHTFGITIVGDFLRRDGWQVIEESDPALITERIGAEWIDAVGLSLAQDCGIQRLSATIRGIRRASRNPDTRVIVGGRLFVEQPHLVNKVGADAMAIDGRHAVQQVRSLAALLARRA